MLNQHLEFIHATDNCIASFYCMEQQPKLKNIDLSGNPISKHPHYRLMCIMCAGTQLKMIDNEAVKFNEREFAKKFIMRYPQALEALRAGWLLDMKVRTEEEFNQVIQRMQSVDMDDRKLIRDSEVYQDLSAGNFKVGTESIKLNPEILDFGKSNNRSSLSGMNESMRSNNSNISNLSLAKKRSSRSVEFLLTFASKFTPPPCKPPP